MTSRNTNRAAGCGPRPWAGPWGAYPQPGRPITPDVEWRFPRLGKRETGKQAGFPFPPAAGRARLRVTGLVCARQGGPESTRAD